MKLKKIVSFSLALFVIIFIGSVVFALFTPKNTTTNTTDSTLDNSTNGDATLGGQLANTQDVPSLDTAPADSVITAEVPANAQNSTSTPPSTGSSGNTAPTVPLTPAPSCGSGGTCTIAQVAVHNKPTDCWVIYERKVYNITKFVQSGEHRKNDIVFTSDTCGTDITLYYNGQLALAGVGKNAHPTSYLSPYYIANLQ